MRESVTIGVPDPTVRLRVPQTGIVTVNIGAEPVERRLAGVAVVARGGRPNVRVAPQRVNLVVRGAPDVLESLEASAFEAAVDLEGLRPGQFQVLVRVNPPPNVTVVRVDPAQVQVRIP